MIRLDNYSNSHRLTEDECASICNCSKTTIAAHRRAGLLPYSPSRPIRITVGDFKIYLRMMNNGVKKQLHRTLAITGDDMPIYSRLDGVQNFTDEAPGVVIRQVIERTDSLWQRYAQERKRKAKREKKRGRKAATLHRAA